jgi:hypothetical protein
MHKSSVVPGVLVFAVTFLTSAGATEHNPKAPQKSCDARCAIYTGSTNSPKYSMCVTRCEAEGGKIKK